MSGKIVAQLQTNDSNFEYFIQKNDRNCLKGLLWVSGASVAAGVSLSLTVATAGVIGLTTLASMGILISENLRNSIDPVSFPVMVASAATVIAVDYLAVKFTGFCFCNAVHHIGQEFQIIRQKKIT